RPRAAFDRAPLERHQDPGLPGGEAVALALVGELDVLAGGRVDREDGGEPAHRAAGEEGGGLRVDEGGVDLARVGAEQLARLPGPAEAPAQREEVEVAEEAHPAQEQA